MPTFRTSRPVSAADPSRPHLILVGLPGAGKSAVGGLVAEALGRTFLDFDAEIARREGMSIPDIFAQLGEPHFRALERSLTAELQALGSMTLAPGGGWMSQPESVALLRPPARLVYLRVTPATAMRRMGAGAASRPLLRRGDPVAELQRLLALRGPAYETSDLAVDVEDLALQQVTGKIVDWVRSLPAAPSGATGTNG
jgi:shikimate kinase